MMKLLPVLALVAGVACAGMAHAQGANPAAPATPGPAAPGTAPGTATTRPSAMAPMPGMAPMPMPGMGAGRAMMDRAASSSITLGEVAVIGVGAVAGVMLFQGAMWHGMTVMGAAVGGYGGFYLYTLLTR